MFEFIVAVDQMTYDTVQAEDAVPAIDRALGGQGRELPPRRTTPISATPIAAPIRAHPALLPRTEASMRTATVLVVDDLEGMRAMLGEVLGGCGYAVLTAAGVPEAEALRQHLGRGGLDLVITDLRLTHQARARKGADLIRRWQASTPQLPFILIGGDLRPEDLPELPRRGVWCLPKPFGTAVLLATVADALCAEPGARAAGGGR
jgi:CheY-like chemotaxis protein